MYDLKSGGYPQIIVLKPMSESFAKINVENHLGPLQFKFEFLARKEGDLRCFIDTLPELSDKSLW